MLLGAAEIVGVTRLVDVPGSTFRDLLLARHAEQRFDWLGGESLDRVATAQARYIDALRAADDGDYRPLLAYLNVA